MSNKWQITTLDGAPTYHSEFGTVRFLKYEIVLVKQKKDKQKSAHNAI